MKTLLVVYHSMTGGALQMASAAAGGARSEPSLQVSLQRAEDTQAAEVLGADGIIFATPENLGAMSGKMKDFFDRTYYALLDRINGKPYGTLICAGSDGRNAALQIERIATGWRLRPIAPTDHRMHPRANAARNPAAEEHSRSGSQAMRGTRRNAGRRTHAGDFLTPGRGECLFQFAIERRIVSGPI